MIELKEQQINKEIFMENRTKDYLLNKKVKIFQPKNGYRASTDAVFLAAAISKVKNNDNILDVGSGTGAVSLCLAHRFKDANIKITGLEIQKELAELANFSAKENDFKELLQYINCDIKQKQENIENCSFSHVITNPPYSENDLPSPNESKALAHNHNDFSLKNWIDFCIKMIKPQGYFYMINRAEAIDEILSNISGKMGNINIYPIYSKANQKAKRVIVTAQKNSKTPTTIHNGLVIHELDGVHSERAQNILRDARSLEIY